MVNLDQGLDELQTAIAAELLANLKARAPVDTGEFQDSLTIRDDGDVIHIGSDLDYAVFIELGIRGDEMGDFNGKNLFLRVVSEL